MLERQTAKLKEFIKEFDFTSKKEKTVEAAKALSLKVKKESCILISNIKKLPAIAAEKLEGASSRTIFNTSAVITAMMFLCILPGGNLNLGYKINCEGETAGVVLTKAEALSAYESAVKELEGVPTASAPEKASIMLTVVSNELVTNVANLSNSVVACYDGREDCAGIFVDGIRAAALPTAEEAEKTLEAYKNEYATADAIEVSFNKAVEVRPSRAAEGEILSGSEALSVLKAPRGGYVNYTVKPGDTVSVIAENHGTTVNKLLKANPGLSADSIKDGDVITVSDVTPVLAVRTVSKVTETATVQYETEKVEDKTAYKGTSVTVRSGSLGEKKVEYKLTKENGSEVSKVAVSETVTREPVTAMVKVGTKERPKNAPTGTFIMPYYGTLTSRYGAYRSRGTPHTGIDLAGPTGGAIVASDGGTVTVAEYRGSYGNMVKIKHDNGYETYYAHLSKISVKAGQKVCQGQTIGLVGNTGRSTGPHLHFEIRKNGSPVNPYNYIR